MLEIKNRRFAFTGQLSQPRADVVQLVEAEGGTHDRQVTPRTHYLVVGKTVDGAETTKLERAAVWGTHKITERELFEALSFKALARKPPPGTIITPRCRAQKPFNPSSETLDNLDAIERELEAIDRMENR